ncbi:MAG: tyrosine-type recombinase/integrase [Bdellovibrionales bacterium]
MGFARLIEEFGRETIPGAFDDKNSFTSSQPDIDRKIEEFKSGLIKRETAILPEDRAALLQFYDRLQTRKAQNEQKAFYETAPDDLIANRVLTLIDEEILRDEQATHTGDNQMTGTSHDNSPELCEQLTPREIEVLEWTAKPFRNVDAPVVRYLTEAECLRLVNTCPPDLRAMVQAALLTGCRYGELANLKASDFNPDAGTVAVRMSKSGKPRHVVLNDEGQAFFRAAMLGKEPNERILTHDDGTAWLKSRHHGPVPCLPRPPLRVAYPPSGPSVFFPYICS